MQLALYKGPPGNDLAHQVAHRLTRWWTRSRYSHCELAIDGICYSASARDGGVRAKVIDLESGRWDLIGLPGFDEPARQRALAWFARHNAAQYDYLGLIDFVPHWDMQDKRRFFCSEAIADALGLARPGLYSPQGLWLHFRDNARLE